MISDILKNTLFIGCGSMIAGITLVAVGYHIIRL